MSKTEQRLAYETRCEILAQMPAASPTVSALEDALRTLLDCSNAIVGADISDPLALEAFEMFNAARAKARALLSKAPPF